MKSFRSLYLVSSGYYVFDLPRVRPRQGRKRSLFAPEAFEPGPEISSLPLRLFARRRTVS